MHLSALLARAGEVSRLVYVHVVRIHLTCDYLDDDDGDHDVDDGDDDNVHVVRITIISAVLVF